MKPDIVIDEIREIRHRMSEECDHDLDKFFTMLKKEEKQFEPQVRRYRELERRYREDSISHDDLILRDKPKS